MRLLSCICIRAWLLSLAFLAVPDKFFAEGWSDYDGYRFEESVGKALQQVESILNHTRDLPRLAHLEQGHVYEDKYALAEMLTNTAGAAIWIILDIIGFNDEEHLQTLLDWVHRDGASVTLHFQSNQSCELIKELEVEVVDSEEETKTETVGVDERGETTTVRTKVIQKKKEFRWQEEMTYRLLACMGNTCGDDDKTFVQLRSGKLSNTYVTSSKHAPVLAEGPRNDRIDLTWLLKIFSPEDRTSLFTIDRGAESCKTPRRNDNIEAAMQFYSKLLAWCNEVEKCFSSRLRSKALVEVGSIAEEVFLPVFPLMENNTVLSAKTISVFLDEEQKSIKHVVTQVSKMFPPVTEESDRVMSVDEATLLLALHTVRRLSTQYTDSVDYVEGMLQKQLFQAIGKELNPDHFRSYMRFHGQKLFGSDYTPQAFSYAVRQPNQYPVGVVSIESLWGEHELAETLTRHIPGGLPIRIPIDAATHVEMTGDIYLSGWMQYSFESDTKGVAGQAVLAARARQFSSFLVLVGTMAGSDKFVPKHAIILQNKDEVLIPLITETLPSAREFQDAIASLSPEQQAFAKAFRKMQLESSVFGVCIIQLRPQLEKLLGLPNGALTKEIQLTQELMSLFVDYQIPSDLLSFDGAPEMKAADKVAVVKGYVKAVLDVIDSTKEKQLAEEKRRAEAAKAASERDASNDFESDGYSASSSASLSEFANVKQEYRRRSLSYHADSAQMNLRASSATTTASDEAASSAPESTERFSDSSPPVATTELDFTLIPKLLDAKLEEHDTDGYLRSTIIKAASTWTRKRQQNLLTSSKSSTLHSSDLDAERKKAFDLLDAISRSGTLPIDSAELHVIVAVTHCFDKSIVATLVEDNINPIEKVEKSALLLASTIYGEPANALIGDSAFQERLSGSFPALFALEAVGSGDEKETE